MNDQQRAAMQMALEALEKATMVYEANDTHQLTVQRAEAAITALREALSQDDIDSINRESRLPKRFTKFDGDTML